MTEENSVGLKTGPPVDPRSEWDVLDVVSKLGPLNKGFEWLCAAVCVNSIIMTLCFCWLAIHGEWGNGPDRWEGFDRFCTAIGSILMGVKDLIA